MCPFCVYTCLNIYNPSTIFIISKFMLISLFTLFFGTPCSSRVLKQAEKLKSQEIKRSKSCSWW